MAGFLKGGKFGKPAVTATQTEKPAVATTKPTPFGKKKLGGLNKPKVEEPNEVKIEEVEEVKEEPQAPAPKPKLGAKKKLGGGLKATPAPTEEEEKIAAEIAEKEDLIAEAAFCGDNVDDVEEEVKKPIEEPIEIQIEEKEEPVVEEVKPKKTSSRKGSKKKTTTMTVTPEGDVSVKGNVITIPVVDESKRISIEEMDAVMRPIVAPTTDAWEQEKKDVLEALDNIKVEQDMTMDQVKKALAELDDIRFEIMPKQHDAETMYDGTKQNYDTVKAIAISKGTATNAEGRKAEGILACQNYVTPGGEVVDLHQYMLLIEERNKFYQKIVDTINFKKYSLVNYNKALSLETKDL